jgi:alpha-L-fucosidase
MKTGIIVHYGLYSVPAYDSVKSAKRRSMKNGSEWYLKRLTENNTFRPVSGHTDTKEFHLNNYPLRSYYSFEEELEISRKNVEEWFKLAKKINAEYIIITSKHHDGYCLWPSKNAKYKVSESNDLLKIVKDFSLIYNIEFGIYYSWCHFNESITKKFVDDIIKTQIKELLDYNPSRFFFDGHWAIKTKYAITEILNIVREIKLKGIIINDRIPIPDSTIKSADQLKPSYYNFSDRFVPDHKLNVPWEYVGTIGLSWGRNKQQEKSDYMTPESLKKLYKEVLDKGAQSFLINIGPDKDCSLDPNEVYALEQSF